MTWLSEIEDEATLALEGNEAFTGGYMDDLRMARVIRELARGIVVYRDALLSSNLGAQVKVREENIFSPDAKEVIDESSAPRST